MSLKPIKKELITMTWSKKFKKWECLGHPVFPGGHPSKY